MKKYFLPPTTKKVNMNTPEYINQAIQEEIIQNSKIYEEKSQEELKDRLKQLDYEWDTERVLELNLAIVVLLSTFLGLKHKKKWLLLGGTASAFMVQHALQGWCPPISLIRRLKIRTASEINEERDLLKKLLEG